MSKKVELRNISTNHDIIIDHAGSFHSFIVTVSYKELDRILIPVEITFNNVGASNDGLKIIFDKLGKELSKILENSPF